MISEALFTILLAFACFLFYIHIKNKDHQYDYIMPGMFSAILFFSLALILLSSGISQEKGKVIKENQTTININITQIDSTETKTYTSYKDHLLGMALLLFSMYVIGNVMFTYRTNKRKKQALDDEIVE